MEHECEAKSTSVGPLLQPVENAFECIAGLLLVGNHLSKQSIRERSNISGMIGESTQLDHVRYFSAFGFQSSDS